MIIYNPYENLAKQLVEQLYHCAVDGEEARSFPQRAERLLA